MRLSRTLGISVALIAAALVGGTLIGSALATDEPAPSGDADATVEAACTAFLDTFASELGVTRDELTDAGRAAANAALDAAVAAGDISEERAASVRERITSFEGLDCSDLPRFGGFGGFGHWGGSGGHGPRGGFGHMPFIGGAIDATAQALGIEAEALIPELREAGSLEAVAESHGVDYAEVKAAVAASVQADLDQAVANGDLTQERADAAIEKLNAWLDDGGEARLPFHSRGDDDPATEPDE